MAKPTPFRLLDLPPELQIQVFRRYFEGSQIILNKHNAEAAVFKFSGLPGLDLELVSRGFQVEARKARDLYTSSVLVVTDPDFFAQHLNDFIHNDRYAWVRNHVRSLSQESARVPVGPQTISLDIGPDIWRSMIDICVNLQSVDITMANHPIITTLRIAGNIQEVPDTRFLEPIMRSAFEGAVDGTYRAFCDAYHLQKLAEGLQEASRDGRIRVIFPCTWRDHKGAELFTMGTKFLAEPTETILMSKVCVGDTLAGLWLRGQKEASIQEIPAGSNADSMFDSLMRGTSVERSEENGG